MKEKNKIILLMGVIFVIFVVLCVLFATGRITFSKKTINNKENQTNNSETTKEQENIIDNKNESYVDSSKIDKVYFGYFTNINVSYVTVL